jgi:hypothetical protein
VACSYLRNSVDHPKGCDIFLRMAKHRHVPVEIGYAAVLFLKRFAYAINLLAARRSHVTGTAASTSKSQSFLHRGGPTSGAR